MGGHVDLLLISLLFLADRCAGGQWGGNGVSPSFTGQNYHITAKKGVCAATGRSRLIVFVPEATTTLFGPGKSSLAKGIRYFGKPMSAPSSLKEEPISSLRSSLVRECGDHEPSDLPSQPPAFGEGRGALIAVLTEPDACHSTERMDETLEAITSAVSSGCIDLVSIRVVPPNNAGENDPSEFHQKLVKLIGAVKTIREDLKHDFVIVVNDNVHAAIDAGADGVHVKERDVASIPSARKRILGSENNCRKVVIGTSCHSIESALLACQYCPDYLFVGTCYMTKSHPEKTSEDMLEGPALPGKIRNTITEQAILYRSKDMGPPVIFAIGGIDEANCAEPVEKGSNGVAVIRSILCAPDPAKVAKAMKENMNRCLSRHV